MIDPRYTDSEELKKVKDLPVLAPSGGAAGGGMPPGGDSNSARGMNPDDLFYLRFKGRITGPLDWKSLQNRLQQGSLSGYEISTDGRTWKPVAEFFNMPSNVNSPTEVGRWHYQQHDGSQCGPLSLAVMQNLIEQGDIVRSTLIWENGLSDWTRAEFVPEFTPLF